MSEALHDLARSHGVATEFWDWRGQHIVVEHDTVVAVLAAMGVDASTEAQVQAALRDHADERWRRMLPPCLVVREGVVPVVHVHVRHGSEVRVWVEAEDGRRHNAQQHDRWVEPHTVDGHLVGEATFGLPGDLSIGYHTVVAEGDGQRAECSLIVTPRWVGVPDRVGQSDWGVSLQLYSVRSRRSWGVGDFADLRDVVAWCAEDLRAGFVLANPLHAAEPTPPMEPSPYLPSTRRYINPIYLHVEAIPEVAYLSATDYARVVELGEQARQHEAAIDRDACWTAKLEALHLVHGVARGPAREGAYRRFVALETPGLHRFAVWSALASAFGSEYTHWPQEYQRPDSPEVAQFAEQHAEEVDFFAWLQWVCDEQLAEVARTAEESGMSLGLMCDLAVGVHPEGSDAWALQDVLAEGITVGAPPDAFNQAGQDWSQPPWRPDALEESGYQAYRDLLRTVLRHSAGLRVDHIIGLFRLWWIPDGSGPAQGTYVRYDHEALVGILALEAVRAGAVLVGEDLGTVEPWVRDYLAERGILGTSVLWFERDHEGRPLPTRQWRELCLATVTTHDLPPTAGYLAGDHVRLRNDLGLLTRSLDEELRVDEEDRQSWLDEIRSHGLLAPHAGEQQTVEALHRMLRSAPSRLMCAYLTDMVGDRRTQNQPGTEDEYPNWRVPLSGPDGAPIQLEDVISSRRVASLADVFRVG
jgi:4-alpha-glucanotransferase